MNKSLLMKKVIQRLIIIGLFVFSAHAAQASQDQYLQSLLNDVVQMENIAITKTNTANVLRPGQRYLVRKGDTLSNIAMRSFGHTPLRLELVMDTIIKLNPEAFFRSNGNFLFAGKTIHIPSIDDFRDILFKESTKFPVWPVAHVQPSQWIRFP